MCRSMSLPVVTVATMHNLFVCTRYFSSRCREFHALTAAARTNAQLVYTALPFFCAERISSREACFLVVVSNLDNSIFLLHLDSDEIL